MVLCFVLTRKTSACVYRCFITFSGNFTDIYLRTIAKPKTLAGIMERRTSAGCNGIPHMAYK